MNEPIELLRSHFGLTPAEARVALHLVAGETLRSAEVKLSISYETARTHLKIFDKTGTCRQAELIVVLVTALPGCVRLGSNEQISGVNEQIPGGGSKRLRNTARAATPGSPRHNRRGGEKPRGWQE
jgi:DNA-binding CsgD family transcriptional regulator